MPLTQQQIDQFERDGFLPCENMLTPLEVSALHLRLEDIGNPHNLQISLCISLSPSFCLNHYFQFIHFLLTTSCL